MNTVKYLKLNYVLEFENDLNYANLDISNLVFEFYTAEDELSTIQTDEWGKKIDKK